MEYNELYHHGVKGQKWGRRLYQYKDGSLTPLGKRHYAKEQKKEEARKEAEAREKETREEKHARLLKSTDANELYKNRELLSTAEINERINRIDTERRLGDIAAKTKQTGMQRLEKALSVARKVDEVYKFTNESAIGKALKKKLGLEKVAEPFDLEKLAPNLNKLSDDKIQKIANRVENMSKINKALKKKDDEDK